MRKNTHLSDEPFLSLLVPRALRGTKMPIFEVKSDEIQTSAGSVLFCVSVAISSKPVNFGCRCKVS